MKQTRRFLALLLALCLSWSQVSPAFAVALDEEQTEPVVVVEETVAAEVVETEAVTEAPEVPETEAPAEEPEVIETEAATEAPEVPETEAPAEEPEVIETEAATEAPEVVETEAATEAPEVVETEVAEEEVIAEEVVNEEAEDTTGTAENPEPVYDPSNISVSLAEGDADGYYLVYYNKAASGTMTFYPSCADETVEYEVTVTNATTGSSASLSESTNGTVDVEIAAWDMLTIWVGVTANVEGTYAAADITMTADIVAPMGTRENPMIIWDLATVVEVPAGSDQGYYLNFSNRAMTGTLVFAPTCAEEGIEFDVILTNMATYESVYLSDSENGTVSMDIVPGDLINIQILVSPDADWNYPAATVSLNGKVVAPIGNMDNPAELVLGDSSVDLEAASQGYYYTWTAPVSGEFTFTMTSEKDWMYCINNLTSYIYGDYRFSDGGVATDTLTVIAGDEIQLLVNTYNPEDMWGNPAGTITFNTTFVRDGLSEEDAMMILDAQAGVADSCAAGATLYYQAYGIGGMIMTVSDAENLTLTVGGTAYTADESGVITLTVLASNPRMPVAFSITNNGDAEAEYAISFTYPLGTMDNPAVLTGDTATAAIEAGSQGYFYSYTATERGTLTMGISAADSEGNELGWTYVINNLTTCAYGDTQWSDSDPVVNPAVVEVNVGDELQIVVNTYDPENMWANPAGDVTVTVSFEAAYGSASNPIYTSNNEEGIIEGVNPANADVYYNITGINGATLTIENAQNLTVGVSSFDYTIWQPVTNYYEADENGVLTFVLPEGFGGLDLVVCNDSYQEVSYKMVFTYPLGHMNNPAELVLGENTAEVAENSADSFYFYNWTATGNGVLTFTMNNADNWSYYVNNLTTGVYGEWMYSDTGSPTSALYVHEGDMVEVMVNTYDPNSWSGTPAGTINFTVALDSADYEVISGKNLPLTFLDANGKKVSGSKVNWSIAEVYVFNPNGEPVKYDDASAYATLKNGTLKTLKCGDQVHMVINASLKSDETVTATYYVDILPAANKLGLWMDDMPVTGTWTRTFDVNVEAEDDQLFWDLDAVNYPLNANQDVNWKSSNTKVATVDENGVVRPVWDAKKETYKTGTVTITATAADGSGKKATIKISFTKLAAWVEIERKDGQAMEDIPTWWGYEWDEELQEEVMVVYESTPGFHAAAGSTVNLTAKVDPNASAKGVNWYCYSDYATVKNGKLTIAKDAPADFRIYVSAHSKDYNAWQEIVVIVDNPAVSVLFNFYNETNGYWPITEEMTLDVSGATADAMPSLLIRGWEVDSKGSYVDQIVDWTVSDEKLVELTPVQFWTQYNEATGVETVHYDLENMPAGYYVHDGVLVTPKWNEKKACAYTGTVSLTGTASDGETKASAKISLMSLVSSIEISTKDGKNMGTTTIWKDVYNEETDEWEYKEVEMTAIFATAGQSLNLKATVNANAANKGVYWYCYGGGGSYATISNSGKLTIAKDVPEATIVWVDAYAKDNGNKWVEIPVIITPRATNVHLRAYFDGLWGVVKYVSNTTKTWDINVDNNCDGEPDMTLDLSALVYPFDASQDVKWTVNNKNIATIEETVNDNGETVARLTFTGTKFGKLVVTATSEDGSKVKTSFTLNVVSSVKSLTLDNQIIAAGKSIKLADKITINPANATNTKLTWEIVGEANGATLNAKTGVLNAKKVDVSNGPVEIAVKATSQDTGVTAECVVTVYEATKTINIYAAGTETVLNKKTETTTSEMYAFEVKATEKNAANQYWYSIDNAEDFGMVMNQDGSIGVVLITHEDGTVNYGTVKVTVKALDGTNKTAWFKVTFAAPEAE